MSRPFWIFLKGHRFEGQIKVIFFQRHYKYVFSNTNLAEAITFVKVTKYLLLSDRFELSTPKLCKTKWITNDILRYRAKFNVSDFTQVKYEHIYKKPAIIFHETQHITFINICNTHF